jgi:uncharacterized glyoxalase superfamily protein PhnB
MGRLSENSENYGLRSVSMIKNRSMPQATIIPEIPYPDVNQAASWLARAFGFAERLRIGNHRVQLTFGDGAIIVTSQEGHERSPYSLMVRVPDVDAHCRHAESHGAKIVSPPTDYLYGERQYTATDFAGHTWTFSQTISDIDPSEWGGILV